MMMEAKHTPGPWVFGEWSSNKQGVAGEVGWVDVWSKMPDGTSSLPIASCRHKQQMENARLIAAAPELLDLLKLYAAEYNNFWRQGMPIIEPEFDALMAKIHGS